MTSAYVHSPGEIAAAQGDPLLARLVVWLRSLPGDALTDVRDTPAERWRTGKLRDCHGRRCLAGIARGSYDSAWGIPAFTRHIPDSGAAIDFDRFAERHGLSVVVPLLQQAAAAILRERAWETAWAVREVAL